MTGKEPGTCTNISIRGKRETSRLNRDGRCTCTNERSKTSRLGFNWILSRWQTLYTSECWVSRTRSAQAATKAPRPPAVRSDVASKPTVTTASRVFWFIKDRIVLKTMLVRQGSGEKYQHDTRMASAYQDNDGIGHKSPDVPELGGRGDRGAVYPGRPWSHDLGTLKPLTITLERSKCHPRGTLKRFLQALGARILAKTKTPQKGGSKLRAAGSSRDP